MKFPHIWKLGTIDADAVERFATASLDANAIHLSKEAALSAGLDDGPIVHGMLIYSMVEACLIQDERSRLCSLSIQFVKPLLVGSELDVEARQVKQEDDKVVLRILCKDATSRLIAVGEASLLRSCNFPVNR